MDKVDEPPARGTRPKDRRAVTVRAATRLFYRNGYANVSVAEIARETNVVPSAIFRHFGTKSELLVEAILNEVAPSMTALLEAEADGKSLAEALRLLAETAMDNRELGVLWQREARSLDDVDQKRLRDALSTTTGALARFIRRSRGGLPADDADFLAWCAMGAIVSIGFHGLTLPHDEYVDLLVELTSTVAAIELPAERTDDASPTPTSLATAVDAAVASASSAPSRRDDLVREATELFAERGFGTVAVDDIGTAAGIAGPSIYTHFASKQKILLAALERGNDILRADTAEALATNESPRAKLAQLVDSYVGLAVRDRFLTRIVLSEVNQLDPADREFARHEQREYIDTWTGLLRDFRPMDATAARIRVQAVLLVVSDAAQTPHLRQREGFQPALVSIARALLGLDE